jgi:SAM-dependent methyltransferase
MKPETGNPRWAERSLLHRGGTPGTWGSLGLWTQADDDYGLACRALAEAVGRAAGVQPGQRVLSVACGAGDELLLWQQAFGATQVEGVERDPVLQAAARALAGVPVHHAKADLAALRLPAASFDHVLCVDGAYQVAPRPAFFSEALRLLKPGGRLACTDLVVNGNAMGFKKAMLSPSAWLTGVGLGELADDARSSERLRAAGFADVQLQRLDDEVLGGFASFVWGHGWGLGVHNLSRAWRRPAYTAGLIGPCRFFGLGYALLSATRP